MADIQFCGVGFRYGKKEIFSNFSAVIQEGKTTLLFGASGSGKTTLLRLMLSLAVPSAGVITGIGQKPSVLFQEDRLLHHLGASANVALVLRKNFPHAEILRHLAAVGLPDGQKPVGEFSGGMRRRVALVRAIMSGRPILLMDEPFKGLDEDTKGETVRYIRQQTAGRTTVIVSHDQADAALFDADILRLGAANP